MLIEGLLCARHWVRWFPGTMAQGPHKTLFHLSDDETDVSCLKSHKHGSDLVNMMMREV